MSLLRRAGSGRRRSYPEQLFALAATSSKRTQGCTSTSGSEAGEAEAAEEQVERTAERLIEAAQGVRFHPIGGLPCSSAGGSTVSSTSCDSAIDEGFSVVKDFEARTSVRLVRRKRDGELFVLKQRPKACCATDTVPVDEPPGHASVVAGAPSTPGPPGLQAGEDVFTCATSSMLTPIVDHDENPASNAPTAGDQPPPPLPHEQDREWHLMMRVLYLVRHELQHVARVHFLLEDEDSYYVGCEYVEGTDLLDLQQKKGVDTRGLKEISRDLARGCCELHRRGIIHMDLKLENAVRGFSMTRCAEEPGVDGEPADDGELLSGDKEIAHGGHYCEDKSMLMLAAKSRPKPLSSVASAPMMSAAAYSGLVGGGVCVGGTSGRCVEDAYGGNAVRGRSASLKVTATGGSQSSFLPHSTSDSSLRSCALDNVPEHGDLDGDAESSHGSREVAAGRRDIPPGRAAAQDDFLLVIQSEAGLRPTPPTRISQQGMELDVDFEDTEQQAVFPSPICSPAAVGDAASSIVDEDSASVQRTTPAADRPRRRRSLFSNFNIFSSGRGAGAGGAQAPGALAASSKAKASSSGTTSRGGFLRRLLVSPQESDAGGGESASSLVSPAGSASSEADAQSPAATSTTGAPPGGAARQISKIVDLDACCFHERLRHLLPWSGPIEKGGSLSPPPGASSVFTPAASPAVVLALGTPTPTTSGGPPQHILTTRSVPSSPAPTAPSRTPCPGLSFSGALLTPTTPQEHLLQQQQLLLQEQRTTSSSSSIHHLLPEQFVVGTDQYIAPEAYTSIGRNPARDWWSVGVILYALLTGRMPFRRSLFDDKPGENVVNGPVMRMIKAKMLNEMPLVRGNGSYDHRDIANLVRVCFLTNPGERERKTRKWVDQMLSWKAKKWEY
mmetsp:Transcript_21552/g.54357  ORF Transcript_21552/g.54357 Transcript_21552/m.54357 type:complete len:897 (+) Transcript_21552:116-2806(+)